MKIAIYTCITNQVDNLIEDQPDGADYFIYSDKDPQSKRWKFRQTEEVNLDPRRIARYYKLLSHRFFPDYDVTIWMDGTIQMLKTPQEVVECFLENDGIGTYIHPRRSCAYDEAQVCKEKGLDKLELLDKQMWRYEIEGFPGNNGLAETKVVVRDNSISTKLFNIAWFQELSENSKRDQVSFPYIMWKTKTPVTIISPPIGDHGFFKFHKHAKSREETNHDTMA